MEARSLQGRTVRRPQIAPRCIVAVVASLVALGLGTTTSLAARGGNGPVSGIVIGITGDRVEIQSATGPVNVAITDKTRVIRTVSGTVADLRRGQIVDLAFEGKSGRVAQIHIAPPGTKLPESNPGRGRGRGRGRAKNHGPARLLAHSGKTIRVRYGNGQVVTYRLVSTPSVIKDVRGRIGDITIGQTVLVTRSQGGRVANVITILSG